MLQYIVKSDDTADMVRQAKDALQGGCRWIELFAPATMSDNEMKKAIEAIQPLAKEKEATLTVASRVTLAKDTGVDGVQLYEGDMPATAARMELEAGPVIGVSVTDVDEVERHLHFDIDYFRLEKTFESGAEHLDTLRRIAEVLSGERSDKPLAAAGGINADNVDRVLAAGAEGIAIDSSIVSDGSTEECVRAFLVRLASL